MRKTTILLLGIFLLSSCYKDSDYSKEEKKERPPHIIVNGEVYGNYLSSDGASAQNLSLDIGGSIYDLEDGLIPVLALEKVNKHGQFVEFFQNGERVGGAQLNILENDLNYIEILTESVFDKEEVALSDVINLNDNLSLSFVNAALSNASGNAYQGTVIGEFHVSEDEAYNQQLLEYGFSKEGEVSIITVASSFFLALETTDGELLDLVQGELEINSSYGNEFALYNYDEEEESWIWVSDFSTGINTDKLSNLGWYAIGTSQPAYFLEASVTVNDVEVVKQKIVIEVGDYSRTLYSTAKGRISTVVPTEETVDLRLISLSGQEILSLEVPSGESNVSVDLPPETAQEHFIKSDFEVIDCDGNILETKVLSIEYPDGIKEQIAFPQDRKSWFPVKGAIFNISSGDGAAIPWKTDNGEIHYLSNCSDLDDGFTMLKIREDRKVFSAFTASRVNNKSVFSESANKVRFIVEADEKGTYTEELINLSINDEDFGPNGYFISCENAENGCGIEICEITYYKDDGDEWNRIYFEGTVWMQTISPPQVGNFKVEGYILSRQ